MPTNLNFEYMNPKILMLTRKRSNDHYPENYMPGTISFCVIDSSDNFPVRK